MVRKTGDQIKTLVLPTLCGSAIWKQIADTTKYDKIIFNGGITTRKTASVNSKDILRNVWDVLEFSDKHKDKVEIILSRVDLLNSDDTINYDTHLIDPEIKKDVIDVLNVAIKEDVVKVACNIKNYIFSYGAISRDWYFNVFDKAYRLNCAMINDKTLCEKLQSGFKNKTVKKEFHKSTYGLHIPSPPLTMYTNDISKGVLKGYKHICAIPTDHMVSVNHFDDIKSDGITEVILHNTTGSVYNTVDNKYLRNKTFPILTLNI